MRERDEIEDYEEGAPPTIERALDARRAIARLGSEGAARRGDAVDLGNGVWARVEATRPGGRALLSALSPGALIPGRATRPTGERAALPPLTPGAPYDVRGASWVPASTAGALGWPAPRARAAPARPWPLGIEAVDRFSPPALAGLTLVVDPSPEPGALSAIARSLAARSPEPLWIAFGVTIEGALPLLADPDAWPVALAALAALAAAHEGPVVLVARLDASWPAPDGRRLSEVVDRFAEWCGEASVIVGVETARSGLSPIADALGFGAADTTIAVDERGRFDPARSSTRLDQDASIVARCQRERSALAREEERTERAAIFGDDELDAPADLGTLRPDLSTRA